MLTLHILAGLVSLIAGAFALIASKGASWHRRAGAAFGIAMLAMSSSAVAMAATRAPNLVNLTAGLLTFYLVATAWLTVRAPVATSRGWIAGLATVAAAASLLGFMLAADAMRSARGTIDGVPAAPLILFGVVGLLGVVLDLRLLRAGSIAGSHRIARHLWRMMFALWIATTSAFLGQAKFLPALLRESGVNALPVLLVTVLLVYWLVRVLRGRRTHLATRALAPAAVPVSTNPR